MSGEADHPTLTTAKQAIWEENAPWWDEQVGVGDVLAADAGGDWLLGGGVLLPDPLRRGLDARCRLSRLDFLSQVGNARPLLVVWLRGRTGKTGLELVTQGGQFG